VKIWRSEPEPNTSTWFIEALAGLKNMRRASHSCYVCRECGYTTSEPVTGNCVACASPAEAYEAVELAH